MEQKFSSGSGGPGKLRRRVFARGAFTLIELLIVVAIIAILAAIAVPNFLEAQTRAKVSRVKSDARSLATAVETYRLDWNRYAPRTKFPTGSFTGIGDVTIRADGLELGRYTTPIAYMSSLPVDVFERAVQPPNNLLDVYPPNIVEHLRTSRGVATPPYVYAASDTANGFRFGYVIMSVGPDGKFGHTVTNTGKYPVSTVSPQISWNWDYDPTNGSVSSGNVYRFSSPGATAFDAFN
ncbi:prepilin-type N-terminal cleavage/methylation domain-containing protein [Candidatus Sumerlaeota bacterium]|nr:prepilin-type N-terminal cleavage/methylation domain-containing protein [Candidatus Sumerlaeota bacterium]